MTILRRVLGTGPGTEFRAPLFAVLATVAIAAACADASSPTGPGPNPPEADPYDHSLAPGASAADLLSSDTYDSLVVQIQYVEGLRPSDAGLAMLADFLTDRLNKPRGIEVRVEPALQIGSQATYSVADVRALEQTHRTAYTEGSTLAIHFLFLGGEFSDQSNVLGFAYNNTSMAIFQGRIQDNTGGVTQPSQATVEGVVLKHEIGHNLGLVNNGSEMQVEHQDEPNGRHCDDENCLMYFAVRTTDFIANLLSDVPDLDQNCLDDLQANGGS